MDVSELLARLRSSVEGARAMPMSSSAIINRGELLAVIDALEAACLPSLRVGPGVATADGDVGCQVEPMTDEASRELDRLVSESEIVRAAEREAERTRAVAQRACDELRQETDEYVDGRLANLEVALLKTLEAVTRGRDRLHGRSDLGRLDDEATSAGYAFPERPAEQPAERPDRRI